MAKPTIERLSSTHSGCQPKIYEVAVGEGGNSKPKISSAADGNTIDSRESWVFCSATPNPNAIAKKANSKVRNFATEIFFANFARIFPAIETATIKIETLITTNWPYPVCQKSEIESSRV